ncbi:putative cytochrome P450 [Nocardia nova SH22a]|uniref:Putative cytochrome P450 n=1 Tax=Nocardia nova SH22a TaxID=1415166 RepID=W5TBJ6_9NOCA|nr:cytochrome P450 [Nocardia nova]AHH16343.1 putative cytochrome P450 [Nocardia nova SH22a]
MTSLDTIDVFDQERYLDGPPYADFAVLRRQAPVFHHRDPEVPEGHWALTRHADIVQVARHPELFSSERKGSQPQEFDEVAIDVQRRMMIHQDPPRHSRIRGLVNRGFTPRAVDRLRPRIAEECAAIVDNALAQGEFDLIPTLAAELPLIVIAELMGIPRSDRHLIFEWSRAIAGQTDHEHGGAEATRDAVVGMSGYAAELGAERRRCPLDDTVTKMVSPDDKGNQLTDEEFQAFFILMTVAGNETTRYSIAGGVEAFTQFPDQWARLKQDPELARTAAEEIVRWVSPTKVFRRTALADTEVGGQTIHAGDKVMAHLVSANRDETVFADPEAFDIGRDPNPHLGFGGGGPHFCIGKHLAVTEIEIMFETLARKVERIEITGPTPRLRSYQFTGITAMPVRIIAA